MYKVSIYNNVTKTDEPYFFNTKKEANKFVRDNTEKRGFDFFCKNDRSLEYQKGY